MRWTAVELPDLSGTRAVVTGGNSGIGFQTVKELARAGAHVVLAARDVERGKQAAHRIELACPGATVSVGELDLARITSIREFAATVVEPLDLLINNAGVMAPPRRRSTADGFELQFGTNHLGHYVLTGLLLPSLLAAAHPRVVTVSSLAHFGGNVDVVHGNAEDPYRPPLAYANSKLANLLFARELQRRATERGTALVSTAAHPGVASTGLVADREGMGASRFLRTIGPVFVKVVTQSAAAGARATLYAATVAAPGSYTGPQRLGQSRGRIGPARQSVQSRSDELAAELWTVSEQLTGLRYEWPPSP